MTPHNTRGRSRYTGPPAKEIMPELIANDEAYAKTDMRFFEKKLLDGPRLRAQ